MVLTVYLLRGKRGGCENKLHAEHANRSSLEALLAFSFGILSLINLSHWSHIGFIVLS
jgi:hypothetical protein